MDLINTIKSDIKTKSVAMTLREYIDQEYDRSQRYFARVIGVTPPQITQWLNKDFIVVDDVLYSPRRDLPKIRNKFKKVR